MAGEEDLPSRALFSENLSASTRLTEFAMGSHRLDIIGEVIYDANISYRRLCSITVVRSLYSNVCVALVETTLCVCANGRILHPDALIGPAQMHHIESHH